MRSSFPSALHNSGSLGDSNSAVFNMTGSVTRYSDPFVVAGAFGYSVQGAYTSLFASGASGVTGSIKVQTSNYSAVKDDRSLWRIPSNNWTDLSGSTRTLQISGSTNYMDVFADPNYAFARVVYANTNGSGSLTLDVLINRQP